MSTLAPRSVQNGKDDVAAEFAQLVHAGIVDDVLDHLKPPAIAQRLRRLLPGHQADLALRVRSAHEYEHSDAIASQFLNPLPFQVPNPLPLS